MRIFPKRMGMVEARDIRVVSIPFAAGCMLACFVYKSTGFGEWLWWTAAGCALTSSGLLIYSSRNRHLHIPEISFCFLLLGLTAFLTGVMVPTGGNHIPEFGPTTKAMEHFIESIDGVGFGRQDTGKLLKALLCGRKNELDRRIVEAFRTAGASHILALSGLHLGMIYLIMDRTLRILGKFPWAWRIKSVLIVLSCCFYAVMTGCAPSIVRALLFIIINEFLKHQPNRLRRPTTVLCLSLMIQLVARPSVIDSVGFQLSYLAMAGISTLFPILDSWYPENGKRSALLKRIWTSTALSISCQAFTAPLVWIRFRSFPVHFILTNLISVPLTESAIVSGLTAIALNSLGLCPQALIDLTDCLCHALVFSLEVISGM